MLRYMRSFRSPALLALPFFALLGGCNKPERYTTKVEVLQVQRFGQDPKAAPVMMDLELKFIECPGDARKVMRGIRRAPPSAANSTAFTRAAGRRDRAR